MSLEPRSGNKVLLKLLLEKTTEVLTQSQDNKISIDRLHDKNDELKKELVLIKK